MRLHAAPIDDTEAYWSGPEKAQAQRMLACSFVGSPEILRRELTAFIDRTGADELMVATAVYDHGTWQREKSQGELAGAWWRNTGDKLLKLLYQRAENLHGVTRMPESTRESKPALPDRLSIDSKSPHFNQAVLTFQIGINFNGVKKTNVEEYCISEGWVRIPAGGKSKDRHGNPMTVKITGKVEPFYVEEGV